MFIRDFFLTVGSIANSIALDISVPKEMRKKERNK